MLLLPLQTRGTNPSLVRTGESVADSTRRFRTFVVIMRITNPTRSEPCAKVLYNPPKGKRQKAKVFRVTCSMQHAVSF